MFAINSLRYGSKWVQFTVRTYPNTIYNRGSSRFLTFEFRNVMHYTFNKLQSGVLLHCQHHFFYFSFFKKALISAITPLNVPVTLSNLRRKNFHRDYIKGISHRISSSPWAGTEFFFFWHILIWDFCSTSKDTGVKATSVSFQKQCLCYSG